MTEALNLTAKQESFCLAYIETGNASEAYRTAYNAEGMKPESVHRKAAELMDNVKVTARIEALQAEHRQAHDITVEDLIRELEESRQLAISNGNPSAAISATMGKAKILGFDKQKVEISSDPSLDFAEWVRYDGEHRGSRTL